MDKISCIIIEDELPAADELKYILSKYEIIDIKGIANDGESGYELIKNTRPKAVFMDINIPMMNGMQLAHKIKEIDKDIIIIFVTAYEQHALSAFEVEALDYILKPYDEKRIDSTISRLIQKSKVSNVEMPEKMLEIINKIYNEEINIKKIPCEDKGKIILINLEEIYYCFIEDDQVFVKTKDKKYYTSYKLSQIEGKTNFFKAHRSYLVNLDHIKELYSWFNGSYKIIINDTDKSEIPVSRNNVRKLKDLIGL
jgi:two-component system, LytTR family, response regulator LytT